MLYLVHFYCTDSADTLWLISYALASNIPFLQCKGHNKFSKNSRRKKLGIKTVFRPPNKLNSISNLVKDTINLCTPVAYEVLCSCGTVYIGEKRRLTSTKN